MEFALFKDVMSFDTKGRFCIEIQFSVKGNEKFDYCWMGKMPDRETNQDSFWYGLTPDGKNAYEYPSFEEFSNAIVFDGHSLLSIWNSIIIEEINGGDSMDMIQMYLSGRGGMGAPQ